MADSFTTRPVFMGTHGIICSGHYLAARAGQLMFDRGGNAVDAAVASGFALNLLEPHNNGLGGEVPILVYSAKEKKPFAISGQGFIGAKATVEWFRKADVKLIPGDGFLPATVPAAFGSWCLALMRFGKLALKDVLEPVIDYAASGFPVYAGMRNSISRLARRFRDEWPSSAAVYLPDGKVPAVGDVHKNPDWAATLKKVVEVETRNAKVGREAAIQAAIDYWYRGEVAEKIVDFMQKTSIRDASGKQHSGLLTKEDFAAWKPAVEEPVSADYRGLTVFKCGPWCQGPVFLQQLRLLEGFDLPKLGHNSAAYIHTVVEAAKLAFADRERFYGDPLFVDVPLKMLLSKDYADERRKLIDPRKASLEMRPGHGPKSNPEEEAHGTPLPPGYEIHRADTTHTCAVDRDGNMMAATCSGGWIPSSPVVPGLGFPMGTARPDVLARPAPGVGAVTAQTAADHLDAVAGAERRQTHHGLRHTRRRSARSVDPTILPQPYRFRHEPPGSDRRADVSQHSLPQLVLSARGARRRPGSGEPHSGSDAERADRSGPQANGRWKLVERQGDGSQDQ